MYSTNKLESLLGLRPGDEHEVLRGEQDKPRLHVASWSESPNRATDMTHESILKEQQHDPQFSLRKECSGYRELATTPSIPGSDEKNNKTITCVNEANSSLLYPIQHFVFPFLNIKQSCFPLAYGPVVTITL